MINRIKELCQKHKSIIIYLVFGVITTVVNFIVYFPLYNLLGMSATVSNVIAWAAAVIVAFLTNKPFVFNSNDWSLKTTVPEFVKFVGCRVGSGLAETGIIFLTVDLLSWNGNFWKIVTSVLVVILNYVASKLFVFRK